MGASDRLIVQTFVLLFVFSDVCASQNTNTPIHNILSTAPQLSISQKALGTLPEDIFTGDFNF
jgi:hypothetical protein